MKELADRARTEAEGGEALGEMISSLESQDHWQRYAAAAYLGKAGDKAKRATDALVSALLGPDRFVAREAARSLGEIGPGASRAVPALIEAVRKYPNADIGWFSAHSLGQIANPNDPAVTEVLDEATRGPESLAYNARRALEKLEERAGRLRNRKPDPSM
jgi:HEAT repeat protein